MCKFCDNFNFNRVGIDYSRGSIYLAGAANEVPFNERFKFCPVCGKRLEANLIASQSTCDSLHWHSKEFRSAGTMEGEIVRAVNLIEYRYSADGNRIEADTCRRDCDLAARFLKAWAGDAVKNIIDDMCGIDDDNLYAIKLDELKSAAAAFIDGHPELKQSTNLKDIVRF